MAEFEEGDVVQLKSGGPPMTITEVLSDGQYKCEWFEGSKPMSAYFKQSALAKIQLGSVASRDKGLQDY